MARPQGIQHGKCQGMPYPCTLLHVPSQFTTVIHVQPFDPMPSVGQHCKTILETVGYSFFETKWILGSCVRVCVCVHVRVSLLACLIACKSCGVLKKKIALSLICKRFPKLLYSKKLWNFIYVHHTRLWIYVSGANPETFPQFDPGIFLTIFVRTK